MRYFFNLTAEHNGIPDREGIDAADIEQAHAEALRAIAELRQEDPSFTTDWKGWRLEIADATGTIVLSINLDAII
jgi:hypothetical protein